MTTDTAAHGGHGPDRHPAAEPPAGLGWSAAPDFAESFAPLAAAGCAVGRVTVSYGIWLTIATSEGDATAALPGRARRWPPEALPVVGDWVAMRPLRDGYSAGLSADGPDADADAPDAADADLADGFDLHLEMEEEAVPESLRATLPAPTFLIEQVLPRRTRLARKAPGNPALPQVLAANIDVAWLVAGLGPDFNPRRLERFLGLAREGGATPVVVLNKADLVTPDEAERCRVAMVEMMVQIRDEDEAPDPGAGTADELPSPDSSIHVVSCESGLGLPALRATVATESTVCLLGSSGVGKTSLLNFLLGHEAYAVAEVREKDGRGRHTTTRRQLVKLEGGGLLVDTPGIRELQVWDGGPGTEATFPDFEDMALQCRFTDCGHTTEPGCAVNAAVESGELSTERFDSWRKLLGESAALAALREARAKAQKDLKKRTGPRGDRLWRKGRG